jgi:DNA-binding PadR family transcriptional regulator
MELALLGFLRDKPLHGYQIHQTLSDPDGLGQIWHLKQSQLYALLAKLEKDELVVSFLQNQEPHPPRRMFKLTSKGQNAYFDWLRSPVDTPRLFRQEFMAKLYFARHDGRISVKRLIDSQRNTCLKWLEKIRQEENRSTVFNQMVCQYRVGQIEAMLAWLETLEVD